MVGYNYLGVEKMETKVNTQPRKTAIFRAIRLIFVVIIIFGIFAYVKIEEFKGPVDASSTEIISVEIQSNSGTAQIAQTLYQKGLINNATFFRLYVRNEGLDRFLRAGNYDLSPSMSMEEIIDKLLKGQENLVSFTIPEGLTLEQIAYSLQRQEVADAETFLELAEHGDFDFRWLDQLPEGPLRFEGFLFPDTYRIPDYFSEEDIIQLMLNRFTEIFNEDYEARMNELGWSIVDVVTLASIIEREIKKPGEQAIASAVFHNRLKINMLLQSCATVQYVLGEVKEVLTNADLAIESPYNTYKNAGLPPGPIAAPGKGAIEAALYPSDDDYLYFVAKPDGSHHFSRTLSEHNQAKNKYLR